MTNSDTCHHIELTTISLGTSSTYNQRINRHLCDTQFCNIKEKLISPTFIFPDCFRWLACLLDFVIFGILFIKQHGVSPAGRSSSSGGTSLTTFREYSYREYSLCTILFGFSSLGLKF